jgi:hypothetical protein
MSNTGTLRISKTFITGCPVIAAIPVCLEPGSARFSVVCCNYHYDFITIFKKAVEIFTLGSQTLIPSNKRVVLLHVAFLLIRVIVFNKIMPLYINKQRLLLAELEFSFSTSFVLILNGVLIC